MIASSVADARQLLPLTLIRSGWVGGPLVGLLRRLSTVDWAVAVTADVVFAVVTVAVLLVSTIKLRSLYSRLGVGSLLAQALQFVHCLGYERMRKGGFGSEPGVSFPFNAFLNKEWTVIDVFHNLHRWSQQSQAHCSSIRWRGSSARGYAPCLWS